MKIIILGAGQVGGTLAHNLASEANDITVVDSDASKLENLRDRIDISVVKGYASHPDVLVEAGIQDADMLVAVTNNDETNMMACQVAYSLFRTPTKIARIRSQTYLDRPELFSSTAVPIDVFISPEEAVSRYIYRLIENPGALQVLDFAEGKVQLVAIKAYYGGPLVGQELRFIRQHMPSVDMRVAAIFRQDRALIPAASTIIEAGDEVFFIAARSHIRAVMSELRRLESPYKRITIAGGGNIGLRLARELEAHYSVRVIERDQARCVHLSEQLQRAIVLKGSSSDQALLLEENIEDTDVFLALTNDDEANIMSSLLAKRLGARKVMTLINNPAYVDLVQGGEIDIAISPQLATIGSLLTHVRRGDIVNVYSLRRGAAEAIEIIAHGDARTSRVVGKSVSQIKLPEGANISAVIRENVIRENFSRENVNRNNMPLGNTIQSKVNRDDKEVLIAHDDLVVEAGDHVILFVPNKKFTREIEKLFQVGFSFF